MQDAIRLCMADQAKRAKTASTSYKLFYGYNAHKVEGVMHGTTIKKLCQEFKEVGGKYNYAFITLKDDESKIMRYFIREKSSGWFNPNRTGIKRKKKVQ